MTHDLSRYDPVWRAAEPYMRARRNDVHIPLSFGWGLRLLTHFPQAERDKRTVLGRREVDDVCHGPDGRVLVVVTRHQDDPLVVADIDGQRDAHTGEDDDVVKGDQPEKRGPMLHWDDSSCGYESEPTTKSKA